MGSERSVIVPQLSVVTSLFTERSRSISDGDTHPSLGR